MLSITKSRFAGKKSAYWKYCLIIVSLVLVSTESGVGQTNITSGEVSGVWSAAGSPYYIQGEITVPNGTTLTIEPGVNIVFMGHYKLNVQGQLLAVGTQTDSIHFTADNTSTGWHGIRFINTPNTNDNSNIIYCSLKYGKANTGSGYDRCGGAIFISGVNKVLISDCLFEYNMTSGDVGSTGGPGVCIFNGSPMVTKSTFIHNDGTLGSAGAIKVDFTSNAVISNNIISNNTSSWGAIICAYQSDNQPTISGNIISNNVATVAAGGILIYSSVKPRIENNIIFNNQAPIGGGIYCLTNANPVLVNNTIVDNSATSGGGIYCESNCDPIFINNILYGNSASTGNQVYLSDNESDPIFFFCDIQGGKDGFGGVGAGTNYNGLYVNNIDSDPLFLPVPEGKYILSNYSQCIGSGIDSIGISGVWYKVPPFCIMRNPRPSPDGTNPDIGACENILGSPLPVELTSFTAEAFDQKVILRWTTATELNNNGFEVQRKAAENEFATIGFVKGEGTTTNQKEYSYIDKDLVDGKYFYRLKQIDYNGTYEYSSAIEVDVRSLNDYLLEQNYPNPFNPSTTIGYVLKEKTNAKIILLNAVGEEIAVLANEEQDKGFHKVEFNAANLPSGVYFYGLQAGDFVQTRKMILLK